MTGKAQEGTAGCKVKNLVLGSPSHCGPQQGAAGQQSDCTRGSGLGINKRRNTGVKMLSIPCYGRTEIP